MILPLSLLSPLLLSCAALHLYPHSPSTPAGVAAVQLPQQQQPHLQAPATYSKSTSDTGPRRVARHSTAGARVLVPQQRLLWSSLHAPLPAAQLLRLRGSRFQTDQLQNQLGCAPAPAGCGANRSGGHEAAAVEAGTVLVVVGSSPIAHCGVRPCQGSESLCKTYLWPKPWKTHCLAAELGAERPQENLFTADSCCCKLLLLLLLLVLVLCACLDGRCVGQTTHPSEQH